MRNAHYLICCIALVGCSPVTGATGQIAAAFNGNASTLDVTRVARFKSLYSFKGGPDGAWPLASVIMVDGVLYGTTAVDGGCSVCGTVFKLTTSGKETVLHSFTGRQDGSGPFAGLVNVDGALYGTTEHGGAYNGGTLFTITPSGRLTIRYDFGRVTDGAGPTGNLLNVNGTIFGTTNSGGTGGNGSYGTVFRLTPSAAAPTERVLHRQLHGRWFGWIKPYNAGVIDLNGALYGTTWYGGSGCQTGCGTVFTIAASGTESVIHNFVAGSDGASPVAGLVAFNGTLYGTTYYGGPNKAGTVFSIAPSGTETVLHTFGNGADGTDPESDLIVVNGELYGTTQAGGTHGAGTIFKITPSGTETVLYNFAGPDGSQPSVGLVFVKRTLYGTTFTGGSYGNGTVFSLAL